MLLALISDSKTGWRETNLYADYTNKDNACVSRMRELTFPFTYD